MNRSLLAVLLPFAASIFPFATGATAAALDLERTSPVPATEPIPVQDFFRPPLLSGPKFNSTGERFVAAIDQGDRYALLAGDLKAMKFEVLEGLGTHEVATYRWLDSDRLLVRWIKDKFYAASLNVVEAGDLRRDYVIEANSAVDIVGVPRKSPMGPIVWIVKNAYDEGRDGGVVQMDAAKRLGADRDALPGSVQERKNREELNLRGMRASVIRSFPKPDGLVVDYIADKDGELAYAITAEKGVFALHRFDGKSWIGCPVDMDKIEVLGPANAPGQLIVVGPRTADAPRPLQLLDAATGQLGEVVLQDRGYDATSCSLYRHPATGDVLGVRSVRTKAVAIWFDEAYKALQKTLDQRFPGQTVELLGSDDREKRFFFAVSSDRQPPVYNMIDLETRTIGLIKSSRPWLDPARMQPMNILRFKTRDGRQLDAYLTLPAGASKEKPAPMVVLPHGGPWVRDEWGFDGEVQFLASRGYAVLQPNYRGSTGTTWMFPIEDQWAFRKMHEDVNDAVATALGTGLVDEKRLAIMGGSFGGYLAACGATFEPDRYRCAVTIAGVFDWAAVIRAAKRDQFDSARFGILQRNLGDPAKQEEQFAAISPLLHIDRVKIPMFVAHGDEDPVAAVGESKGLVAQLKKFNVPFEKMIVSGEGHGMYHLKNEVELYTRIEAFLAEHLAPAK